MRRPHRLLLPLLLAVVASLEGGAAHARIPQLEAEGPSLPKKTQFLGFLNYGQTSAPVRYTRRPKYRAFSFRGNAGDWVELWVRSDDGDAVFWVTDDSYSVVAAADDEGEETNDAHLLFQLQTPGTFHIFFRDLDFASATFLVALTATPGAQAGCPPGQRWDDYSRRCVEEAMACGGFAGRRCPAGYHCVDDPRDSCDPRGSGRDCVGMCIAGNEQQPPAPPACRPVACTRFTTWDQNACRCVENPRCGGFAGRGCPAGLACVDDPRDSCDPRRGADCPGICAAGEPPPPACAPQSCPMWQRWDLRACRCVDNPSCGGFAGRGCPAGLTCVDDPRDSCDPRGRGRDCAGVCVSGAVNPGVPPPPACNRVAPCQPFQRWDMSSCRCADAPRCDSTTFACPSGTRCIDDPRDECDARYGGRECAGYCL